MLLEQLLEGAPHDHVVIVAHLRCEGGEEGYIEGRRLGVNRLKARVDQVQARERRYLNLIGIVMGEHREGLLG